MSILQTTDLRKYYGAEPNVTKALDGVTLSVEEGEFVAIVGTSGSGKSTLLNMMGGLDVPTAGSVRVKGRELAKLSEEQLTIFRRRSIGFVFQNYNLVPVLNVYENIVLPIELDGGMADRQFMDEVVRMLALEDKLYSMPNNLSGGQQQELTFCVPSHGAAPREVNEITTTDLALKALGVEPAIGASVPVKFEIRGQTYHYDMVLSGWWDAGNDTVSLMVVSEQFVAENPGLFQNTWAADREMAGLTRTILSSSVRIRWRRA